VVLDKTEFCDRKFNSGSLAQEGKNDATSKNADTLALLQRTVMNHSYIFTSQTS
jgi:hypothetical protein